MCFARNHGFTCCFPLIQLIFCIVAVSELRKLVFHVIAPSSTLELLWHLISDSGLLFWMHCFLLSAIRNTTRSGLSSQGTGIVWLLSAKAVVHSLGGAGSRMRKGWAGELLCPSARDTEPLQVLPETQRGVQGWRAGSGADWRQQLLWGWNIYCL